MSQLNSVARLSLSEGRGALRLCNSFNRLSKLRALWEERGITNTDWLTLLGEEWSGCDNISQHKEWLVKKSPLKQAMYEPDLRRFLMTTDELAAYDALRGPISLWRGCYANNKRGLSWSRDRAAAIRFPTLHRYQQDGQPLLLEAKAKRRDIIAVKLDRGESEIIAWGLKPHSVGRILPSLAL